METHPEFSIFLLGEESHFASVVFQTIIVTWLFEAILLANKSLTIILSPLLKCVLWYRMYSVELRALLCICFHSLDSLGGCSEHRCEFLPYRHCLSSCLQIIMALLTFEQQRTWVWVCKCHSLCMAITGQGKDLVLSTLSEDGLSVCHCVHQVHWHELPEDYRHELQSLAFWGLQASNHRSLCLHSKHFITELSLQPTDYFISKNRSLVIYHMEILSPKSISYCWGCIVTVDEGQWHFLMLKSNLNNPVPLRFLLRRPHILILYLCKYPFVSQAFHIFPWEDMDDL